MTRARSTQEKADPQQHRTENTAAFRVGRPASSSAPPALGMADLAFAITFLDTFTVGLVSPIYPQLVQGDVLGATLFAVLQSTANAAALVASTLFGRLSDVHGRRAALIACTLCTLIGYVCYIAGFAFDGNPRFTVARLWLPSIGRVLSGVGRAALNGPLIALLVEDEADTSSRVSRTMAMCGFGYATGSAFGGFLVGRGGPSANLTLIGTMSVLSVLCTLRLPSSAKPANEGPTPVSSTSHTPSRVRWWSALLDALSEPNMRLLLLLQAIASSSFQVYDATSALYMMDALGYSAAERGFLPGMIQLGRCYGSGIGVMKDVPKAIDCYKAAFRRGEYSANASLAYHYRYGIGVAKDEIEAYAYLSLASDRFPEARTELASLGGAMGSEQRAAGQRRAKEMHAEVESAKEAKPLEYR